jgi:hypothetical protein
MADLSIKGPNRKYKRNNKTNLKTTLKPETTSHNVATPRDAKLQLNMVWYVHTPKKQRPLQTFQEREDIRKLRHAPWHRVGTACRPQRVPYKRAGPNRTWPMSDHPDRTRSRRVRNSLGIRARVQAGRQRQAWGEGHARRRGCSWTRVWVQSLTQAYTRTRAWTETQFEACIQTPGRIEQTQAYYQTLERIETRTEGCTQSLGSIETRVGTQIVEKIDSQAHWTETQTEGCTQTLGRIETRACNQTLVWRTVKAGDLREGVLRG